MSINIFLIFFFAKKIVKVLSDYVKKYCRKALQNTAEKCSLKEKKKVRGSAILQVVANKSA